jgi:hypothetical protein
VKTGLLVLGWRGMPPMDPVPAGGERCTAVVQASEAIRPILPQTLWGCLKLRRSSSPLGLPMARQSLRQLDHFTATAPQSDH